MNVKNIAIIKPVDMFNHEDNKIYINEQGLILVEFEDNSRRYLDIKHCVDITDYKTWTPLINKDARIKYLFKGDTEYYD